MGVVTRIFRAEDPELAGLARQATEAALRPGQLEHEIDWVADSDHGRRSSAGVLGLYDEDRLAGYLPFRYRGDGLLFRFAGVRLGRLPYRIVELFGHGVVAHDDQVIAHAVSQLESVPWPFHAVAVHEAPTESPLWRAIAAGDAHGFQTIEGERSIHHVVDLPPTMEQYMGGFSSKTRNTWKRNGRKLEGAGGPLTLRTYTGHDEVTELLRVVEPVCRKTYHYHLLGQDLSPGNARLVRNLSCWAQRGWLRGYVLFAGERPVAYVIGSLARGRFSYDMPGYDPELKVCSPGLTLLVKLIEDLIAQGATLLDFGGGDADYKKMLATRSFPEASALLVRRTPYAQGIAHLQRGMASTAKLGAQLLQRFQLKSRAKNWLRGRRLRGAPIPV